MPQRTLIDGLTGQKFESDTLTVNEAGTAGAIVLSGNVAGSQTITNAVPSRSWVSSNPVAEPEQVGAEPLVWRMFLQLSLAGREFAAGETADLFISGTWGTRTTVPAGLVRRMTFRGAGAGVDERKFLTADAYWSGGAPNANAVTMNIQLGAALAGAQVLDTDQDTEFQITLMAVALSGGYAAPLFTTGA